MCGAVWVDGPARSRTGCDLCTLPAELLSRGDYVIKVSGIEGEKEPEPLASYSFRVTAP